jgi:protein gp37
METADQHTYIVLTKRPDRMLEFLTTVDGRFAVRGYMRPLPNVWIGVTAENQRRADERIPLLLQCPAAVRFVSIEPMLGPIRLVRYLPYTIDSGGFSPQGFPIEDTTIDLDWIIVGGETGPGARKVVPDSVRSVRDQCKAAGVPFFFKSWGKYQPIFQRGEGHLLDGMPWRQWSQ